jgi:hypothetical protein
MSQIIRDFNPLILLQMTTWQSGKSSWAMPLKGRGPKNCACIRKSFLFHLALASQGKMFTFSFLLCITTHTDRSTAIGNTLHPLWPIGIHHIRIQKLSPTHVHKTYIMYSTEAKGKSIQTKEFVNYEYRIHFSKTGIWNTATKLQT